MWQSLWDEGNNVDIDDESEFILKGECARKAVKTAAIIEKESLNENLSEWEKISHILKHGSSLQKTFIIDNMQKFLVTYPNSFWPVVVQGLMDTITTENQQYKCRLGDRMNALFKEVHQLNLNGVIANAMITSFKKLADSKDDKSGPMWKTNLLSLLKFITPDAANSYMKDFRIESGSKVNLATRLWLSKIIGPLSYSLDIQLFEGFVDKKLDLLAQDVDADVRVCIGESLAQILASSKCIGKTRRKIVDAYLELVIDDEISVREVALSNFTKIMHLLTDDELKTIVGPFFVNTITTINEEDFLLYSKEVGSILYNLSNHISSEDKRLFMDLFCTMAKSIEEICRVNCAFNFPAIIYCADMENTDWTALYQLMLAFSIDPTKQVRMHLSAGLSEIIKILPEDDAKVYVNDTFSNLVADIENDVIISLTPNCVEIVEYLFKKELGPMNEENKRLCEHLLTIEKRISTMKQNVDCEVILLNQFKGLNSIFGPNLVFAHFAPLMFQITKDKSSIQVKEAKIQCLCTYIKHYGKLEYFDLMMRRVLEIKRSPSYHHRILFLKICDAALTIFSRKYFKEVFFNDYMDMSKDPVSNIRLKFLTLVPRVRQCFQLPNDSNLLCRLTDTIGLLMTAEHCNDVSNSAKSNLRFVKSDSSEAVDPIDKAKEDEEEYILKCASESSNKSNSLHGDLSPLPSMKKPSFLGRKSSSTTASELMKKQVPISSGITDGSKRPNNDTTSRRVSESHSITKVAASSSPKLTAIKSAGKGTATPTKIKLAEISASSLPKPMTSSSHASSASSIKSNNANASKGIHQPTSASNTSAKKLLAKKA